MIDNLDHDVTQMEVADALIELHGGSVRFDTGSQTWLTFDEQHGWSWDHHLHGMRTLVEQTLRHLEKAAPKRLRGKANEVEREKFMALRRREVRQHMKNGTVGSILKVAETRQAVHCRPEDIDAVPHLLGTPNGVVDLRTGELTAFDRSMLITKRTAASPDATITPERFARFISEVLNNDAEAAAAFQRLGGYLLTGETHHQQMWILEGSGSNGKSTLLSLLQGIFGPGYSQQAPEAVLMARTHPGGTSGELVRLKGVRCAILTETGHGQRLNEERVKQLVAADRIAARELYKGFEEFVPQAKYLLATNHLPVVRGSDDGIWRRLVVIPFRNRFEVGSDPTLMADLKAEADGILAWLIEGAKAWYASGRVLVTPAAWVQATRDYRSEQDDISAFVAAQCTKKAAAFVGATELYDAFRCWCLEEDREALTQQEFGARLMTTGLVERRRKGKANRWHYVGLALRHPAPKEATVPPSLPLASSQV